MAAALTLGIPQVEDVDVEGDARLGWQPWRRYVEKACAGSDKVTHWLRYAVRALLERATGERDWDERPVDELLGAVAQSLPAACPYATLDAFVDTLRASGHLPPGMANPEAAVVCDAAALCVRRWSGTTFAAFAEDVMWGTAMTTPKAVAAALFLLHAWSAAEPRRDPAEEALLATIARAPDADEGPRLVYADWLLEHGDARGELIVLEHAERTTPGGIGEHERLARLLELAALHGFLRLPRDPDRAVLPFTGGGSHPTQYFLEHDDGRRYYLRSRYGFSIEIDDETVLETELDVDDPNDWNLQETNVILSIVSDAIRRGPEAVRRLTFPDAAAIRADPRYRPGRHPRYVVPEAFRASRGTALDHATIDARDLDRWHALFDRLRST